MPRPKAMLCKSDSPAGHGGYLLTLCCLFCHRERVGLRCGLFWLFWILGTKQLAKVLGFRWSTRGIDCYCVPTRCVMIVLSTLLWYVVIYTVWWTQSAEPLLGWPMRWWRAGCIDRVAKRALADLRCYYSHTFQDGTSNGWEATAMPWSGFCS